jgi:DNA repair photolyase
MDFREIQAKTILTKCGIPGIDYVINPYIGCRFACKYCYASFMGRFVGKTIYDWGEYVYAKMNAPNLLKKEIKKLKNKGKEKEIFFSSVTDPYQGAEGEYELTRKCLEILADYGFEGVVSILTKSNLVLRDIDVFKKLKTVIVGLTVTSTDDGISRYFEKNAPGVSARLETLKVLNKNRIKTYAFIGPLLPHFVAQSQELEKLFKKLTETGTKDIYIEHLNLAKYIRLRLIKEMKDVNQGILQKFYSSQSRDYREELEEKIKKLIKKYKMDLLSDMVIFHKEFQKLKNA